MRNYLKFYKDAKKVNEKIFRIVFFSLLVVTKRKPNTEILKLVLKLEVFFSISKKNMDFKEIPKNGRTSNYRQLLW